ncbi:MAG: hypothetical protein KAV42_05225 [Candidatus Krumholzibacteria bacterium]|nr:hypothetical protein [Candidatus Krumholzibacteria bacterium]
MKTFRLFIITTLIAVIPAMSSARESRFYLKASGGGSYPMLPSLTTELSIQGNEALSTGYSFAVSLGKTFRNGGWAGEAWLTVSRYPSIHYQNNFEDFNANLSKYSYAFVFKRCLRPGSKSFVPWVGAGLGYGSASLVSGAVKLDGFEGLTLLQLEHRIKDNISLLVEGIYSISFSEKRFSSSFLETSHYDTILDSMENPLNDRFSSFDLRIGVTIWLKPPRPY